MKQIRHGRRSGGFSLFEAILISVILAVLIAMFLPALRAKTRKASRISCANNLKQIALGFRFWAADNNDEFPMQRSVTNGGTMEWIGSGKAFVHFRILSNELNTPKILFCPNESDARRTCASVFADTASSGARFPQIPFTNDNNVSYFVGVDATPDQPAIFLSGDANLAVGGKRAAAGLVSIWTNAAVTWAKPLRDHHGGGGYILLVDGSVSGMDSARLRKALAETGAATNRLAMP